MFFFCFLLGTSLKLIQVSLVLRYLKIFRLYLHKSVRNPAFLRVSSLLKDFFAYSLGHLAMWDRKTLQFRIKQLLAQMIIGAMWGRKTLQFTIKQLLAQMIIGVK